MFAQRFDPTAVVPPTRKRRHSVDSDSDSGSSGSDSDSESAVSSSESGSESDSEAESQPKTASEQPQRAKTAEQPDADVDMADSDSSASSSSSLDSESESESDDEPSDAADELTKNDMDVDPVVPDDDTYVSKHSGVFSKFKKSMAAPETALEQQIEEEVPVQDLAPLPQPELPRDKRSVVNYSQLNNLNWLTTPMYAAPELTKAFGEFGLSASTLRALENSGFTEAFSVQITVLELLLKDIKHNRLRPDAGGDVLVNASTGSGKTLAYTIPVIEGLKDRVVPRVRAIILVPTKPLINQVRSTFNELSKGTSLRITTLKNDISIKEEAHKLLSNVPDIIISTPGRLVEHLEDSSIDLGDLRYLVIDEADRLLNQSFQNWCSVLINKIEADTQVPGKNISNYWSLTVQKLVFSATLTTDAGKLALLKFNKPRLVIINDKQELVNEVFTVPRTLTEMYVKFGSAKSAVKPLLLVKFLLHQQKLSNVLVFTKSNEACLRLTKLIGIMFDKFGSKVNVQYINSTNNTSAVRSKILKQFDAGEINILVATDLIARGIDLLSITDVVNYDMPNSAREYVHRVGRTARANRPGNAYSLVLGKGEHKWFNKLMRPIGREQPVGEEEPFRLGEDDQTVFEVALKQLQEVTV